MREVRFALKQFRILTAETAQTLFGNELRQRDKKDLFLVSRNRKENSYVILKTLEKKSFQLYLVNSPLS